MPLILIITNVYILPIILQTLRKVITALYGQPLSNQLLSSEMLHTEIQYKKKIIASA